jgi:outer membrane protein OmpA-like peptidoglycan-associated protein
MLKSPPRNFGGLFFFTFTEVTFPMLKRLIFILSLLSAAGGVFAQSDSSVLFEVYFPLDQFQLPLREKARVDSVLNRVPLSIVKEVVIYGHTDSLAGLEYNRKLSKNRVLSILQYFVYKGLDPRIVTTDFYGEERPKYDNGPENRYRNRRCEVLLSIDASLLPKPEQKLSDLSLKKGDKLRIPNLTFVGNQPIPMWESMAALEDLTLLMKRNPDLKVQIQGHVCCANDQELSVQRAFTVYSYLLVNGVDKSRMSYKGFSNTKPLFPETTSEQRALNRRVEIEVESNTERRVEVQAEGRIIDITAPVLNLKFFEKSARLMPSGDFMLDLIAEMMAESEGLVYSFTVYDNISDANLTTQRTAALQKQLRRKGVDARKIKTEKMEMRKGMPTSVNDNYIVVQIRPM